MKKILLRTGRPPHDNTSNEAAVAWRRTSGHFSGNSGNMLFGDAVYKTLNTPEATIDCDPHALERRESFKKSEIAYINETYDAYVLPLSNSFRPGFARKLGYLTNLINKLDIPVVVVGGGGQTFLTKDIEETTPEHKKALYDFAKAVLNKSTSIGVRGESTKRLFTSLGFSANDIDVIGCPSLFYNSRDFVIGRKAKDLASDSPIGICTNPYKIKPLEALGKFYTDNEQKFQNLTWIAQTNGEGKYVIWGKDAPYQVEGLPTTIYDKAYLEGRMRFFTNSQTWYEYTSTLDFLFGPRLHGVIAALNGGTPGVLMTIDSRTEELAEYHGIPSIGFKKAIKTDQYMADKLYEIADFSEFNKRMPENWDRYHSFLEKNGLDHIHMKGKANPEYEKILVDSSRRPPGAQPITQLQSIDLANRMRWLWQGEAGDDNRNTFIFGPEFPLVEKQLTADKQTRIYRRKINRTIKELSLYRKALPIVTILAILGAICGIAGLFLNIFG